MAEGYVTALADDFERYGVQAIIDMRERDPSTYCKIIANLLPKHVEVARPLEILTDEELIAAIAVLQSMIQNEGTGQGNTIVIGDESTAASCNGEGG